MLPLLLIVSDCYCEAVGRRRLINGCDSASGDLLLSVITLDSWNDMLFETVSAIVSFLFRCISLIDLLTIPMGAKIHDPTGRDFVFVAS